MFEMKSEYGKWCTVCDNDEALVVIDAPGLQIDWHPESHGIGLCKSCFEDLRKSINSVEVLR